RRRHTRSLRDWSSDVCSSDLLVARQPCYRATSQQLRLIPVAIRREHPCSKLSSPLLSHRAQSRAQASSSLPDLGNLKARPHHRRSEEHTSELQSRRDLVCRLL